MLERPLKLLLVEDNLGDAVLMTNFIQELAPSVHLDIVSNGEDAVNALIDRATKPGALPDAIVLDINLPRKNGFEVLEEIRSRPDLRDLTVFMLSGSRAPRDIQRGYALGVVAFITKPHLLSDFEEMVKNFLQKDLPAALMKKNEN